MFVLIGVICLVVAVMYWLGWEMGAVEAISLSILVGSSVDYCLHLVEGYLLAGMIVNSSPDQNFVCLDVNLPHKNKTKNAPFTSVVLSVGAPLKCVCLNFCRSLLQRGSGELWRQ